MLTAGAGRLLPEEVIRTLREADEYIKAIFTNGGCWQFYKFLKLLYPEAIPFKAATTKQGEFVHIVTRIGQRFFDITGEVHAEEFASCVPVEAADVPEFEQWSFSRNNLLMKRCPHCEEEILINEKGQISKF